MSNNNNGNSIDRNSLNYGFGVQETRIKNLEDNMIRLTDNISKLSDNDDAMRENLRTTLELYNERLERDTFKINKKMVISSSLIISFIVVIITMKDSPQIIEILSKITDIVL